MNRFLIVLTCLLIGAGALAYGDSERLAAAGKTVAITATDVSTALRTHPVTPKTKHRDVRKVDIERRNSGEFAVKAKLNQVTAPMVVDTGATSVVLTYETAKAIGLPLELLDYNVELETASGRTRAARLTLDRLAIGSIVERFVPALVVPRGSARSNLLGMSFLDRLESWEVRADRLTIRGYP